MPQYFGINVGKGEDNCLTSSSTTSRDVEIVVNTNANVPSVTALYVAIDILEGFILKQGKNWS